MIQRIQNLYMLLLVLINIVLIIVVNVDSSNSLIEPYFRYFKIYFTNYFFLEILSILYFINILLFKYSKIQLNLLRFIVVLLVFGIIILFVQIPILDSLKNLVFLYFIISLFLIFMTLKSIKKDLAIIKSSTRLR